jgi:hypothetical protein
MAATKSDPRANAILSDVFDQIRDVELFSQVCSRSLPSTIAFNSWHQHAEQPRARWFFCWSGYWPPDNLTANQSDELSPPHWVFPHTFPCMLHCNHFVWQRLMWVKERLKRAPTQGAAVGLLFL